MQYATVNNHQIACDASEFAIAGVQQCDAMRMLMRCGRETGTGKGIEQNKAEGKIWSVALREQRNRTKPYRRVAGSPGSQGSSTYAPSGRGGASPAGISSSKPVPPAGKRTKRLVMGAFLCDPGRNDRAPFSEVHFSRANQKPRALGGSVY